MQISENNHEERLYQYLLNKYKRTLISKSELAQELDISMSTLSLYIAKGTGIPNYKKLGSAKNAKVVFNLLDVSKFMNQTIKVRD